MTAKVKTKIVFLRRSEGDTHEFIRLSIYPTGAKWALAALIAAGFVECKREFWMRERKAHQKYYREMR